MPHCPTPTCARLTYHKIAGDRKERKKVAKERKRAQKSAKERKSAQNSAKYRKIGAKCHRRSQKAINTESQNVGYLRTEQELAHQRSAGAAGVILGVCVACTMAGVRTVCSPRACGHVGHVTAAGVVMR